jgi:phosphopantothenoylcysteine decarboxylase/phosphopantothenate--cysteine ligase
MQIAGKNILLGVTGSISAYKSADLCRLLVKSGANVKVIMTKAATDFISPLTLSTLSKNPVGLSMINDDHSWNNHVELGLWADLLVVAPASANTIAHFAGGLCDSLLDAVYLSARCPVMIAPAMDHDMYLHESTQLNLALLMERNNLIVGPANGELASGLVGEGRLEEPQKILEAINDFFAIDLPLKGKKVLITAGPTREPIDPVRFISNHSTGKMGVAIASKLMEEGAEVHLVCGPLQVQIPAGIYAYKVDSAAQMLDHCLRLFPLMDAAILSAAVADYTPTTVATEKVKKKSNDWNLELTKTIDIASELGKLKTNKQFLVGFALETNNEIENALDKLKKKNLDFIVLNSLRDEGAGFGSDTNKITILDTNNNQTDFPLKLKSEVATDIVAKLTELLHA